MILDDFDYFMIVNLAHLYFWVLLHKTALYNPKDYVSLFLICFGFVITVRMQV